MAMFVLGIFLFSLDSLRFIIPARSEELYNEKLIFPNDIQLTAEESFKKIDAAKNLPDKEYAIEINGIVHNGIVHYWEDEKKDLYRIRVPIFRNYILYFLSLIKPETYDKYEFCDYVRALKRGVGLCSQQALAMKDILNEREIQAKAMGLIGHVVVIAQVDKEKDEWWVFDPDRGVIIYHDLEEIENNPAIIRPYYAEKGYDEETINFLVSVYGKEGNEEYVSFACETEKKFIF